MKPKPSRPAAGHDEIFMGFRIRKLDGVYIAVPLEWAHGRGETIAASDLPTLRKEIRRWWYLVSS